LRKGTLVLVGLAAYAAFAVATVPASVALARGAPPESLQLEDVQGTLWNGSARATLRTPAGAVPLDRIEWRFKPLQLLFGQVAFDVAASSAALQAQARVSHGLGGLSATGLSLKGDAAAVGALVPLAAAWRPQGQVSLEAPRLAWNDREITGDAQAEWRGASVAYPEPRSLGSYRAELHGTGGPAKLTVRTLEGGYAVRGEGTLLPQRLEVRGQAGGQDFAIRLP
jgi:general secretion pathway protein N